MAFVNKVCCIYLFRRNRIRGQLFQACPRRPTAGQQGSVQNAVGQQGLATFNAILKFSPPSKVVSVKLEI